MSNSEDPDFVSGIKDKLLTIGKNLKNLVHLRRIKEAKVLNPAVLMGLTSASEDDLMRIWGMDPVYPSKTAYTNMAVSIMDEIESVTVLNSRILSSGATVHGPRTATPTSGGRRITARENCTSGSQTIVERRGTGPPPQKKNKPGEVQTTVEEAAAATGDAGVAAAADIRTGSTQAAADTKLCLDDLINSSKYC